MHSDHDAWRADRRARFRRNLPWLVPTILVVGTAAFIGFGHLFVWLWRVTVVDLFGWKEVSFWQAWGLIALSQILFKANMHSTTRTGGWRHRRGRWGDAGPGPAVEQPERAM